MGWYEFSTEDDEVMIGLRSCIGFELESKISSHFGDLEDIYGDLKYGAICDCLFNLIKFANEEKLNDNEYILLIRTQFKLLQNCHDGISIDENLIFFKSSLYGIDVTADKTIDLHTTKKIIDYLLLSFFQHYRLYRFMFLEEQEEIIKKKAIDVDLVQSVQPFPPPLEESIHEDWYNLYVNPIDAADVSAEGEISDTITSSLDSIKENTINSISDEFIDKEKIKQIIDEEIEKSIAKLKTDTEKKINEREAIMLKSINKL